MAVIPPPKERFRDNSILLAHYCKDIIIDGYNQGLTQISPPYLDIGMLILENEYTPEKLIDNFIKYSYSSWEQIKNRDEDFFEHNLSNVFRYYSEEVIQMFKELFFIKKNDGTLLISKEQKDYIWNTLNSLCKICIHQIHESRNPIKSEDGSIIYLNPDVYPHVEDLKKWIDFWGVRRNLRY